MNSDDQQAIRCAGYLIALTADGIVAGDSCGWEGELGGRDVDRMGCPVCGGQVELVPPEGEGERRFG